MILMRPTIQSMVLAALFVSNSLEANGQATTAYPLYSSPQPALPTDFPTAARRPPNTVARLPSPTDANSAPARSAGRSPADAMALERLRFEGGGASGNVAGFGASASPGLSRYSSRWASDAGQTAASRTVETSRPSAARWQYERLAAAEAGHGDEAGDDESDESPSDSDDASDKSDSDLDKAAAEADAEYWGVVTCDPTPISKRLFPFEIDKDEDLTPITRVDLSHPHVHPEVDFRAGRVEFQSSDFTAPPDYQDYYYDGAIEVSPYEGKHLNPTERPWIELGRGMYLNGPIPPSQTWMGETNPVAPHFLLFGDFRTAVAYVDNGNGDQWVNAYRLNLDLDLKITATERIHAFIGPIDRGNDFTRLQFDGGNFEFFDEFDADFDTVFFEGDLGAMLGGAMGIYPPFDMPIAFGIMPMLFQNGTWMLDNFLGVAATIPAKNSPALQWSNFDVTVFAGFDEINSLAFPNDDSQAHMYGAHAFIEAYQGYLEVGYAFLNDELGQGLGYHNVGVSFSRRYRQSISNSIRFIANIGQDPNGGEQTADGQLILFETALITQDYTRVVPYMNLFAGFDRPQSAARAGGAGGVLLNTGINFETDGLTGFPTLDATANDTYGGAIGLNYLGEGLKWQLITELAVVATHGDDRTRRIPGDQYALGMRYQRPISNAWLIRADGMYGIREGLSDVSGARFELRYKF